MPTLFRWLSVCPLWLLQRVGGWMGRLAYRLSPSYRQRFDANRRQAGVDDAAAREAAAQAGRMIMELPWLWMRPHDRPLGDVVQWEGAEAIEAALARGRGVLILTPHMGCFEIAAQVYAEHYGERHPMTVLYRPARKAWLREIVDRGRLRPGVLAAPASLAGVRQMLRALRRGDAVGLLPDQVPPEGMGVWAPFFGRPAYTMTLATRLVRQTGASLLTAWTERLPDGKGFRVRYEPFVEPLPDDPEAQAESAAAVNREIERLILQCPAQYLWGYHRYKPPRAPGAGDDTAPTKG